jgi:thiol-disulfide isomerase/thioredoxin
MKTNWFKYAAALLTVSVSTLVTQAAEEATLKVGDKAPKLQVAKWAQGEPVKELSKGTAYIVEFWATWCGPCRATIPHVNELHKKFKDKKLVVIGQDVWERDESKVEPFIKTMGDKMTYRVAMDDKSSDEKGAMAKTWMEAAGQNGIPSAFVVNKEGIIAWIGHPATLTEKTLEKILDGSFDIKKAAAEKAEESKRDAAMSEHQRALGKAMQSKSWDEAEAAIKDMEKLLPEDNHDGLPMMRAQLAFAKKDYKSAQQLLGKVADQNKENAMAQNAIAWQILTQKGVPDGERDLKLAEKLAARGVAGTEGKDPAILDTLARAQFMNGQVKKAIATQEKALKLVEGDGKEQYQTTLDSYKAGKLPKAN